MSPADLATIAAGIPALAILYRRARRWQLARITDEQQHRTNLAKWRKLDERHHADERRTARKMERRARRIDAARQHYWQQHNAAPAPIPTRAERRARARALVREFDERTARR